VRHFCIGNDPFPPCGRLATSRLLLGLETLFPFGITRAGFFLVGGPASLSGFVLPLSPQLGIGICFFFLVFFAGPLLVFTFFTDFFFSYFVVPPLPPDPP